MITIPSIAAMSKIKDSGKYYCEETGRDYVIAPGNNIHDGLIALFMFRDPMITGLPDLMENNVMNNYDIPSITVSSSPIGYSASKVTTSNNFIIGTGSQYPVVTATGYSVSMWVNFNSLANQTLIGGGAGALVLYFNAGTWFSTDNVVTGYASATDGIPPIVGQWYHIVMVVRGATDVEFFKDNISIKSIAGVGTAYTNGGITNTSTQLYRFGGSNANGWPSDAKLSHIRLYDRPLSRTEVTELYKEGL